MTYLYGILGFGVLALISCQTARPPHPGGSAALSQSSPAGTAAAALDDLDARVPVPLLPMMANHQKENMRDHLLAIQEVILAVGRDDFAGVERAASRIGFSPAMGQMCTHMGAGAKGFTEQALAFHHTADSISAAARGQDRSAVLTALGATLQACTGCHQTFRQQIVDEATWTKLTSMAVPHRPGG